MYRLKKWIVFTDNPNKEPHFHLKGFVYDHPGHANGTPITTSRVIKIENGIATTGSGSEYLLDHPLATSCFSEVLYGD